MVELLHRDKRILIRAFHFFCSLTAWCNRDLHYLRLLAVELNTITSSGPEEAFQRAFRSSALVRVLCRRNTLSHLDKQNQIL